MSKVKAVWQVSRRDIPLFVGVAIGMAANALRWVPEQWLIDLLAGVGGAAALLAAMHWAATWVDDSAGKRALGKHEQFEELRDGWASRASDAIRASRVASGFLVGYLTTSLLLPLTSRLDVPKLPEPNAMATATGACVAVVVLVVLELPQRIRQIRAA
ncbi:membrane hypothetical protein [metagenome]|uniref:Uncharacterized protein n=1 Tax=metagenome TaxID=256318 RepID=A0A2P2CCG1_9ZZZZ